jgi:5-methylcytosine-specific restriction endonuclease McrA
MKAIEKYKASTEKHRQKKIKMNVCVNCGKEKSGSLSYLCPTCILRSQASKLWKDSSLWTKLSDLIESQNCKCPYSGVDLVIGKNASIDHIVPRGNGGTNEVNNLQWVDVYINRMKLDKSHEEFLATIRQIAIYHGMIPKE